VNGCALCVVGCAPESAGHHMMFGRIFCWNMNCFLACVCVRVRGSTLNI
jgi:hypothetical protein